MDPLSLSYRPPTPADPPNIALVGCGQITEHHCEAYRDAGWDVVALCDLEVERAEDRRDEFFPEADVYADADEVFAREDVGVVDLATHPGPRAGLMADAIAAGKHVLSQKPFVLDLDAGEDLVEQADEAGVKLAVNQNGRWAANWSYLRAAVADGFVGDVLGVHLDAHWNHDFIAGLPFDDIRHAVLYDYAIHHFDLVACLLDDPERVHASVARSPTQQAVPPLLGQATVEYEHAQASLVFDGNTREGQGHRTYVAGTEGTVESQGPTLDDQSVTVHRDDRSASPGLEGQWFPTGFRGTMGELLCAIEEDREPENGARDNLRSLELCYAAVASAEDSEPKVPGEVRELRKGDPAALAPAGE
ncbi:MAG: Gfo/Idh/MocA family protein [Halobacteriaceae archaeon]